MGEANVTHKKCSKCQAMLDSSNFRKDGTKKSGLSSACKLCSKNPEKTKEYNKRYRERHPEKIKEFSKKHNSTGRSKAYRLKHPEKARAATAKWVKNNKEKVRDYKEKNKEKISSYIKGWRDANPEARRRWNQKRRIAKLANCVPYTDQSLIDLMSAQNHKCNNPYCQAVLNNQNKEIDHIFPISKGGMDRIENLQWLCKSCNRRKHATLWEEFLVAESRRTARHAA